MDTIAWSYHFIKQIINDRPNDINPFTHTQASIHFNPNADANYHELKGFSYFHVACYNHDQQVARALIQCGADLTKCVAKFSWRQINEYEGDTPLHIAIASKNVFFTKWLLTIPQICEDINTENAHGISPLEKAILYTSTAETVHTLLVHGADPFQSAFLMSDNHTSNAKGVALIRSWRILQTLPAWRPSIHHLFPTQLCTTIRTLLMLYATWNKNQRTHGYMPPTYPQAMLHMLPVELFQHVTQFVIGAFRSDPIV